MILKEKDEKIAEVSGKASAAETKAEGFRLDIAKANENAAEANRIAEEERLARVKIEERFSPRRLAKEQQLRIIEKLRPFAGQQFSFAVYPDPESIDLMRVLESILKSAGWIRIPSQIGDVEVEGAGIAYASGIFVDVAPADIRVLRERISIFDNALRNEGLIAQHRMNPELTGKAHNAINIAIGKKP